MGPRPGLPGRVLERAQEVAERITLVLRLGRSGGRLLTRARDFPTPPRTGLPIRPETTEPSERSKWAAINRHHIVRAQVAPPDQLLQGLELLCSERALASSDGVLSHAFMASVAGFAGSE